MKAIWERPESLGRILRRTSETALMVAAFYLVSVLPGWPQARSGTGVQALRVLNQNGLQKRIKNATHLRGWDVHADAV